MATLPSIETQAKVASEAAQNFIDHYYESLNKRQPLGAYYSSASPLLTAAYLAAGAGPDAASTSTTPDISINGRVVASAPAYEALLDAQGAPVHYDVGSWDAQPVNPDFRVGCPAHLLPSPSPSLPNGSNSSGNASNDKAVRDGERLSFAVQVSGTVRYGGPGGGGAAAAAAAAAATATVKSFSEAWLLVPHWEAHGRNAPRGARRWLVVSQNFRVL